MAALAGTMVLACVLAGVRPAAAADGVAGLDVQTRQLTSAEWSDYHLRRAVLALAEGDLPLARAHLEQCDQGMEPGFEADRAAFLLAHTYLRLGDVEGFQALARRVATRPTQTPYTRWIAYQYLLASTNRDDPGAENPTAVSLSLEGPRETYEPFLGLAADFPGADVLTAALLLREDEPAKALQFLGHSAQRPETTLHVLYLRALAQERVGAAAENTWRELAGAHAKSDLQNDLVAIACLRVATEMLTRGEDPSSILEKVPATSRYAARARHMLALWESETDRNERAVERLRQIFARHTEYADRRQVGLFLGGDALEHGEHEAAYGIYQEVNKDWRRASKELDAVSDAAGLDTLWSIWDANELWPEALFLDFGEAWRTGQDLAETSLDLRRQPGNSFPPLYQEPSTGGDASRRPVVLPPTRAERNTLNAARRDAAIARADWERSREALASMEDELARRRNYLLRGLDLARRQSADLEPSSVSIDSVLTHMDSLLTRLEGLKDASIHRFTQRARGLVDEAKAHWLWIRAMRHFHVEGPNRQRPESAPPAMPIPEDLLREEEALARTVATLATRFAETVPGMIESSFAERWMPGFTGQAADLETRASEQRDGLEQLRDALATALEAMDGGPELAALRRRTADMESRTQDLEDTYRRLRKEIAKNAVARQRALLDEEREAIDYGLAAAAYEVSVGTLGTGGEFLTDSLSTGRRDEARGRLSKFLEDYPRSVARGETRFRLADLLLVEAKEQFNARMARFLDDELPAQGIDDRALVPFVDYDPALHLYRDILENDDSFPHRDAVLFNLGMILSDQGKPESRPYLEELVESFPASPFCQEAYLRLGDDRFDRGQFNASIPHYERAAEGADAGLTAIALYRMGWGNYSQDHFDASADAFRRLLDHYESGQEIALKTDLRTEAEDYLIHSLVRAGGAGFFARYFDGIGPRPYESRLLAGMAHLVRDFSLFREAVAIDKLYLDRYPDDARALGAARRLVDSYEQQNRPREAREARLTYAPRYLPGSRWMSLNPADSLQAAGEDFARTSYQFVALYYHHEARKARNDAKLWKTALGLYDTLLEHWPHHKESGKYNLYAGEAAAKLHLYRDALLHYETAVFEFYSKEASVASREDLGDLKYYTVKLSPETYEYVLDADWQRLAITDEWYRSTIDPGSPGALGVDSLAAAVRTAAEGFLLRHGTDSRAPDALWRKANLGFAHGWYTPAAEDYGQMVKRFPEDSRTPRAAALRGDALYRAEEFNTARHAYQEAVTVAEAAGVDSLVRRITPVIPLCAFRFAEETAKEYPDQPERAAILFQDLAVEWPDYEHSAQALYRAGLGFAEGSQTAAAVRAWDRLTYRYPDSEYAKDSFMQMAHALEDAGELERAAQAYERISSTYPKDENAPDALLKAADLWEKNGNASGAESIRVSYVKRFPKDFETGLSLLLPLAERELASLPPDAPISTLLESPDSRLREYLDLAEAHRDLSSAPLLAEVQFRKGEEMYQEYAALALTLPLEKSIQVKKDRLEKLLALYGKCADYEAPVWARAAAYRIGEALIHFGEMLEASERPPELAGDDLAAYEEVLFEEAWSFYDRGEEAWSQLLRETKDLEEDTGGWVERTKKTLWPRLSEKFLYMPEVEHPVLGPAARPDPVAPTEGAVADTTSNPTKAAREKETYPAVAGGGNEKKD